MVEDLKHMNLLQKTSAPQQYVCFLFYLISGHTK